jgi:hypothetical protein
MLRFTLFTLLAGGATAQFGGFGGFFGGLMSMIPPLPTSLPIPSDITDVVNQVIAGSPLPRPSFTMPPFPTQLTEFVDNILAGSSLPPALPSDLNGPYMALLNGSALPPGLVPSDISDIMRGSELPDGLSDFQNTAQEILDGSALPTRRMPSIPVIPGMPSIDMGPYQDMLGQAFDSVKDMFAGLDFVPADLLKELKDQGFEVPSLDPRAFMSNRDEYLAKIRAQLQQLAEKLREQGLMDKIKGLRTELQDVFEGKKSFGLGDAEGYLSQIGGLVGGLDSGGRLNSTLSGALRNISMPAVHDSLRRIGSLVSQQGAEKFEKMTEDFGFVAGRIEDGIGRVLRFNETEVGLPPLPLLNQTLTLVQWSGNPYAGLVDKEVISHVVSVMLADAVSGNETTVRGLEQLINITVPLLEGRRDGMPECVYWNVSLSDWMKDGCMVQEVLNTSVVCGCNHLTDFAVAYSPPPIMMPVAVAEPSPSIAASLRANVLIAGVAPVVSDSKDLTPMIGGIAGGVGGTLVLSIIAANLWDRRKKARKARKAMSVAPAVKNPISVKVV